MTQPNVHRQASLRQQFRTVTDAELRPQQSNNLFRSPCIGEGPPALCVSGGVSGVHNPRMFVRSERDEWIRFVIHQHRVVSRFVLTNQLSLKDQRFGRSLGDNIFDVIRFCDQFRDLLSILLGCKIRSHSGAQIRCFANVLHSPVGPFEKVDSGLAGEVERG